MAKPMSRQLAAVAEIAPGAALAGDAGGESAAVLMPRDVGAALPTSAELQQAHIPEGGRRRRATVRAGDVVIVARGLSPRSSVVGPETAGAVASANLLVIRPGPQVVPSVLVAFLQTPEGQRRLMSAQTGTTTPSLTVPALGRIEVPLLPLDVQQRLGEFVRAADEVLAAEERTLALRRELATRITEGVLAGESVAAFAESEIA